MCCPPTYLLHWPQQDQQDKAGAGICAGPKSRNAGLPSAKNNTNKHSAERTIRLTPSSSPLARNVSHLRFRKNAARYDTCKKNVPRPVRSRPGLGERGQQHQQRAPPLHATRACFERPRLRRGGEASSTTNHPPATLVLLLLQRQLVRPCAKQQVHVPSREPPVVCGYAGRAGSMQNRDRHLRWRLLCTLKLRAKRPPTIISRFFFWKCETVGTTCGACCTAAAGGCVHTPQLQPAASTSLSTNRWLAAVPMVGCSQATAVPWQSTTTQRFCCRRRCSCGEGYVLTAPSKVSPPQGVHKQ